MNSEIYSCIRGLARSKLQKDLNLIVFNRDYEYQDNQTRRQFPVGSTETFDRCNYVEQAVPPLILMESMKMIGLLFI